MKKLLALLLALSMVLALIGCAAAQPEPDPEPEISEPEPLPTAEGTVATLDLPGKLALSMGDGSTLVLNVAGVTDAADMGIWPGDTIRAEYSGSLGSASAQSLEIIAKARTSTITGVVVDINSHRMEIISVEDGVQLSLDTSYIKETDTQCFTIVQAEYLSEADPAAAVAVQPAPDTGLEVFVTPAEVLQVGDSTILVAVAEEQLTLDRAAIEADMSAEIRVGDVLTQGYVYRSQGTDGAEEPEIVVTFLKHTRSGGDQEQGDGASSAPITPATPTTPATPATPAAPAAPTTPATPAQPSAPTTSGGGSSASQYDDDDDDDDDYYYTPSTGSSGSSSSKTPPADMGDVYEAIRLMNIERKNVGLHELTTEPLLMEMAQVRADEQPPLPGHTRPDGRTWSSVFVDFECSLFPIGENVARGQVTAAQVVTAWMNSPGHKANILKENATRIGVGFYYIENSEYKYYWAMVTAKALDESDRSLSGGSYDAGDVAKIVQLNNTQRLDRNQAYLVKDAEMMEMAAQRAKELAQQYSHTRPDGTGFDTIFDENGWSYEVCAENIAKGESSAANAYKQWLNSASDSANMFSGDYTRIGVGYYKDFWVMLLAKPSN